MATRHTIDRQGLDPRFNHVWRTMLTATPVPAAYKFTWSFSSLNTYDICPRKFWAEKVAKTAPWETNAAATWGNQVHKELEERAIDGGPIAPNMVQYAHTLELVRTVAQQVPETHYEIELGVRRDGTPCGFHDADMFGRGISDVFFRVTPETAIVVDYKTGAHHGRTLQPAVNAKLLFANYPELREISTLWAYLKVGRIERERFHRANIDEAFAPVQDIIDSVERSIEHQNFPAKRGFLCRSYCSDFSCPHNGRKAPLPTIALD